MTENLKNTIEDAFNLTEGVVFLRRPEALSAESLELVEAWFGLILRRHKGPPAPSGSACDDKAEEAAPEIPEIWREPQKTADSVPTITAKALPGSRSPLAGIVGGHILGIKGRAFTSSEIVRGVIRSPLLPEGTTHKQIEKCVFNVLARLKLKNFVEFIHRGRGASNPSLYRLAGSSGTPAPAPAAAAAPTKDKQAETQGQLPERADGESETPQSEKIRRIIICKKGDFTVSDIREKYELYNSDEFSRFAFNSVAKRMMKKGSLILVKKGAGVGHKHRASVYRYDDD